MARLQKEKCRLTHPSIARLCQKRGVVAKVMSKINAIELNVAGDEWHPVMFRKMQEAGIECR